jgi:hypothetical protein
MTIFALSLAACNNIPEEINICLENPDAEGCPVICPTGQELDVDTATCVPIDDTEPLVCPTGQHVENEVCVIDTLTCPTGEHEEAGVCIIDTVTCPTGQHEDDGVCVLDPLSQEEILVQYILNNWDADLLFLAGTINQMDFSTATTITTEVNFEITEDSNVMSFEGVIVDSIVYAETGNTVQRFISLDLEGEDVIEFTIIVQEVETGVHVYLQPEVMIAAITNGDPGATDVVNWIGFDKEWAVFHFDDSLQAVLEVEVLKDMVVGLFFAKLGAEIFDEIQGEIENAIGFDLDVYGVDIDTFMQYLIAEDFDSAEILLNAIDTESIALHADYMYVAWRLYNLLMPYSADLNSAGFDVTQLTKLNTASITEEGVITLLLPVDPLDRNGTIAFFEDMTEVQLGLLIETAIKPIIEEMIYQSLVNEINPEFLYDDFLGVLESHEDFLIENWPTASGTYVPATEYALYANLGPVEYWRALSQDEQWVIHWAVDMASHGWVIDEFQRAIEDPWDYQFMYVRHEEEMNISYVESSMINFINTFTAEINAIPSDAAMWLSEIDMYGVNQWFEMLDPDSKAFLEYQMYNGEADSFIESYEMLKHMAPNQWNYRWYYRNDNNFIDEDWITYTINDLLTWHTTYLTDEYGYDVAQWQTDVETAGGIIWYMEDSTEMDRDVLMEIALFGSEDNNEVWALENLQDAFEGGNYDWWFGRSREVHDIESMNYEMYNFLEMWENYITQNSIYDPDVWLTEVENMGVIEWFNSLTTEELALLQEILDINDPYNPSRWVVEIMFISSENEGQYELCFGNWDHCSSVEGLNDELITLVGNYSGYLMQEYGIDSSTVIADIEMYGAVNYMLYEVSEEMMEAFEEIRNMEHWPYELMDIMEDALKTEVELLEFLEIHKIELELAGFGANAAILDITQNGLVTYVSDTLTEADIEILVDFYVYPIISDLHTAIIDHEVAELIVELFFTDQHVTAELAGLAPTVEFDPLDVFDADIIAANMIAIDFDALVLEVIDFEALAQSIYDGQDAYDLFVAGLVDQDELTIDAPNFQLFLEVLSPGIYTLEDYMVYVDDLNYAFVGLAEFDQFIDPTYYISELMYVNVTTNDDLEIITTMTIDGLDYAELFGDLVGTMGVYMTGFEAVPFPFDENWVCLDPQDLECEAPDFSQVVQTLAVQGDLVVQVVYDPSDLTWVSVELDATDFLDVIADTESQGNTTVNAATIKVTVEDSAVITLPAAIDTTVINDVVDEVARFAITVEAYEMLRDYVMYYDMNPQDLVALYNAPVYLSEIEFLDHSDAFNLDMSFIEVTVEMVLGVPVLTTLDYEITLYWVDGTLVFDDPIALTDLALLLVDGDLASEAAFHTLAGEINDTNWALTKLWLFLLMDQNNNDNEEPY